MQKITTFLWFNEEAEEVQMKKIDIAALERAYDER